MTISQAQKKNIIGYGEVDKETAEHIINLHNKSLKDDK